MRLRGLRQALAVALLQLQALVHLRLLGAGDGPPAQHLRLEDVRRAPALLLLLADALEDPDLAAHLRTSRLNKRIVTYISIYNIEQRLL